MSRYVLSRAARIEMDRIWDYTAEHWGEDQAAKYLHSLQLVIERAAADPHIGRALDDVRPGLLKLPAASHALYYRVAEDGTVQVLRVLHQRMDPGRHF